MALSGSYSVTKSWLSGSVGGDNIDLNNTNQKVTYTFTWKVIAQDAINNTSTIEFDMYAKSYITAYNGENWWFDRFTLTIDGAYAVNYRGPGLGDGIYRTDLTVLPANENVHLYKGTYIIQHNSVDDRSFTYSWLVRPYGSVYAANHNEMYILDMNVRAVTVASTGVIDHIVRNGYITNALNGAATCTDEDVMKIEYINPMGDDCTSLQAGISVSNGVAMEVPYRNISKTGTSYTFSISSSEWKAIYARTLDKQLVNNVPLRFYIKSTVPVLSGGQTDTVVTYMDKTMSFINYMPTMNPVLTDINPITTALTGNNKVFVRYASNVQFNLNASAKKQATITTAWAANGDNTVFATSGVLNAVTGEDFLMQIHDNRGFQVSAQESHTLIKGNWVEYVPLTCAVKNGLLDANGNLTVTITGKYFAGSFGAVKNTLSLKYNIRKNGAADSWRSITASNIQTDSQNNYTYSFTITGLDYTDRYLLTVSATDQVNTQGSTTETIIGAVPVFDWGKNDFAFYVPVTINGATVPSIVEQDTYNGWTYRKWTDGTAECWRNLTIDNVNISNASAGGWYASGNLTSTNLTFPFTFKERPSVTVSTMPTGTSWAIVFPGSTAGNTTQTGSFQLLGTTSTTNKTYILSYQVKGRWE